MNQSTVVDKAVLTALISAPLIVWSIDTRGIVRMALGKGIVRQGFTANDVMGRSIFDLYHDYPEFLANVRRALAGESVHFTLETFDGVFDRWLEPVRDATGLVTGVVGISIDVTGQYRAQQALRHSEEQFRNLVEGSLQGIVIHRDRRFLFVNQAYAELLGYASPDEVYALPSMDDIVVPEERERLREFSRRRLAGLEAPETYETASLRKDGSRVNLLVFSRRIQWQGEPAIQSTLLDITERKKAEQALQESEWQLSRAQQAAHIGTWYRDRETGRIRWSPEMYRLLGLEPTVPASIEAFTALIHPEDREAYVKQRDRALELEEQLSAELRVIRPDGQVRRMRVVGDCVAGPSGRAIAMAGTLEDVTERRVAQDALRQSEQRYRDLVEGSLQGIAIIQDDRYVFANPAYLRMFGFGSLEELQAAGTWHQRIAEHELERFTLLAGAHARGEAIPNMHQVDCLRRDGSLFTILAFSRAVSWNGIPAVQVAAVDITDQRRLERSLRLKDHAIQSASEAIAFGDLQGRIVEVNPAFVKLWGLASAKDAVGRRGVEFWWTPDDLPQAVQAIRARGHWSGETMARRANGETFPVEVRVSTVLEEQGRPVWLMASIVDISERKRTEERQRELEEQLFQAQKLESIGRLVGSIAHDFNNMLTPMFGYAELALASLEPSHPAHRHVSVIRSAAERAADLTRKLLLFGRRRAPRKSALDLTAELGTVVDMLRLVVPQSIAIETCIAHDVGRIEADPALVHQLVMNLALNARDAMPQGGRLTIAAERITLRQEDDRPGALHPGDYLRLSVRDTGHGMDENTLGRIFEPFFTTKPEGRGTGLGLSVVYGIVKQHEGHIAVSSRPGAGTAFDVYLPAAAAVPAQALTPAPAAGVRPAAVLVVEDDPQVLNLVSSVLSRQGLVVWEAEGPEAALRLLDTQPRPADLLLCDVVMPGMNGPALARKVLERWPATRVLFMSGYAKDLADKPEFEGHHVALLDKPFSIEALTRAVREALERE
jgi:PAS domain S-box-containing protein